MNFIKQLLLFIRQIIDRILKIETPIYYAKPNPFYNCTTSSCDCTIILDSASCTVANTTFASATYDSGSFAGYNIMIGTAS